MREAPDFNYFRFGVNDMEKTRAFTMFKKHHNLVTNKICI